MRFPVLVSLILALGWLTLGVLLLGGWLVVPHAGLVGELAILLMLWNLVRLYALRRRRPRSSDLHETR